MFEVHAFDGPYEVSRPASKGTEIILGRSGNDPKWYEGLHPTVVVELGPDPTRVMFPPKLMTSGRFVDIRPYLPERLGIRWLHGQPPAIAPTRWNQFAKALNSHDSLLLLADEDDAAMLWMAEALIRRGLREQLPREPHYLTRQQRAYLAWPDAPMQPIPGSTIGGLSAEPFGPTVQGRLNDPNGGEVSSPRPNTLTNLWEASEGARNGTD